MKRNAISTTKIAEICGVSQGTVDRALNNRKGISEATKQKILSVAKEYGYRPNIHARCIAGGKSQLIGIVIFDINNQYFSDLLTEIENYCTKNGYSTLIMFTDKDKRREIKAIEDLYSLSVDGIVLCPCNDSTEYKNYLLSLDIPIVTVGNKLDGIPYFSIDNAQAVKDTTEYVISKGYNKLIYVKPPLKESNTYAQDIRLESFLNFCKEKDVDYTISTINKAEKHITESKKCAIICPTDIYAVKLLSLAKKHNAGIIGFDNIKLIDELDLKLDSVSYDIATTAKNSIDHILGKEKDDTVIAHKIIKRGSI